MTRIRIAGRLWIVDDELRVSDAFPFIPQVVAHDIPGLFQVPQHVVDVVHILPEDGGQPTHGVILRFLQGEYDGKLALGFERRPLHVLLCAAVIETPRAGVLPDTENPYMNKSHADRPYGAQPHQRPRAGATAAPAGRRHLRGVDVLALNDDDLTGRPLRERRETLGRTVTEGGALACSRALMGDARARFCLTTEQGLEGILQKRLDSCHQPGKRSRDWAKV